MFARELDGRGCNQVFVVFGSFVVVFDPGDIIQARELLREIRSRTNLPIRYVINSHFHPDHAVGAALFQADGAEVVAASAARRDFENWARHDWARKVQEDPEAYHGLTYAPPTQYVDTNRTIDDGVQRLELMHLGHGHTSGDLVGWMPAHRVLFSGDLSTNGQHNLANADLSGWIAALETLRTLRPLYVVPGHKALAGPEVLDKSYRYLLVLREQVRTMVGRGMTYEEILATIHIPLYDEWSGVSVRNEPMHVQRAFKEAGGRTPESPVGKRDVALGGVGLTSAASVVALWSWRRRRQSS